MADIAVQRGTAVIGNTGGTSAPGSSFSSLSSAFVRSSNNRKQHGGRDDENTSNLDINDLSGLVELTATNLITYTRESGSLSNSMRFAWESWEYVGAASGPHEFIVRSRDTVTLTGETNTATLTNNPSSVDNCIPFITGISCDSVTDAADGGTAIAWLSGTNTLNIKRGAGSTGTVIVQVVTVEFTGSLWTVKHGRQEGDGSDSSTITLVDDSDGVTAGGGDITDWGQSIIFHQQVGNNLTNVDDSISDTSATYVPGANTSSVQTIFDSNHVDSATAGNREEHFIHALRNPGLKITRISDTQSLTGAMSVNISSTNLSVLGEASLETSHRSSGAGTAYGRGWVNTRLTSLTNVEKWVHRSGNTISTQIQVIDMSGLGPVIVSDFNTDEKFNWGNTNLVITGIGFEISQGIGKVEFWDDTVGTTKVVQTIDTWAGTSIQIDTVQGALADNTTIYLVVTNNSLEESSPISVKVGRLTYVDTLKALQGGPNHLWMLDNDYVDAIGINDMNQSVVGTTTFPSTPICRGNTYAWKIDDVLDAREAPDSSEMNIGAITERTMGGWIRFGGIQQSLGAIYKEGAQINNMAFLTGIGNTLMAQLADTGDDNVQAYSDFKLTANRDYHICFRYSYIEATKEFRLLIDGVVQAVTDGNPLAATDLDSHSGDIGWGDPDGTLEMGGTDISFAGQEDTMYAAWGSWKDFLTTNEIRQDLFEEGAIADQTISAGTEAAMQTALDAFASTIRPDAPLAFTIEGVTGGGDFELVADNITYVSRVSIQLQFLGTGTLTWVNENGSVLDSSKITTPKTGVVAVIESVPVTVIAKDIIDSSLLQNARVRITADTGGPLTPGTVIVEGLTDVNGEITANMRYSSDQPITGKVRKSTTVLSLYKESAISDTVGSTGKTINIFMIGDE